MFNIPQAEMAFTSLFSQRSKQETIVKTKASPRSAFY